MQRLAPDETAVVFALPGETSKDEATILRRHLLSEDEREAVARFVGDQQQHDRILARSLVRLGLSNYFPVAPADWRFGRDQYQKPFVRAPEGLPQFQFSLSHTRGLIALLITTAAKGGIDAEQMERGNDLALVASKVCAASELESLHRLAGDAWKERFFQLWTLKEAYAKAHGLGLSLPWSDIAFDIGPSVSVRFGSRIDDAAGEWQFSLHRVTPMHMLATAVSKVDLAAAQPTKVRLCATEENAWLES